MSGRAPLNRKAFVFFSSPISKELVSRIKEQGSVLSRISALIEVMERLNEKITNFYSKNKAARLQNSRNALSRELSRRELKEMTVAFPEYIEQKEKLSLHAEWALKSRKEYTRGA